MLNNRLLSTSEHLDVAIGELACMGGSHFSTGVCIFLKYKGHPNILKYMDRGKQKKGGVQICHDSASNPAATAHTHLMQSLSANFLSNSHAQTIEKTSHTFPIMC